MLMGGCVRVLSFPHPTGLAPGQFQRNDRERDPYHGVHALEIASPTLLPAVLALWMPAIFEDAHVGSESPGTSMVAAW